MKARILYLVAAAMTAAALVVPLWGFSMSAPQYPDETLHLRVARTGIGGDVHEVETLQHYIGVRFPTELPELRWSTVVITAIAGMLLAAMLTRPSGIGRAYRILCATALLMFLAVSAAVVQARLYEVGHDRDRNAPIRAVRDFTPPLVGPVKVGNFTVWSFPHVGGFFLLAASVLSVVGARLQSGRRSISRHAPVVVALVLTAGTAEGRTWTVGGRGADFPLIAPAIAAASDGDVVEVRAGVYREDLVIAKRLAIVGVGRPRLFGTGIGTVITIAAPGCELRGFAIEGSGTGQTNAMDAGIHVLSDGNRIVGNTLHRIFYGIVVSDAAHNEVADNDIHGLADRPFGQRGDGIYLYRAPENIVSRNRISGERDAIYFQYAPRGRAIQNVASDSRYALHDMFSDDTLIAENVFADSAVGANIMNSRRIRLERNRIERNRGVPGVGLTLKDCDDSMVRENRIVENARGLLLDGSSINEFSDNLFRANDTALTLFSSAERNTFAGNRFDGNWSDVVLSGRDSGTEWSRDGRGNLWSRYRGFDFDGDGVGDTPHPIVGTFERIEGANPATRIFLHSPAAAGLELAAHLNGELRADANDPRPLVETPRESNIGRRIPFAALLITAAAAVVLKRRS